MSPYFLGFVGHSGSGKTTLIEKVIKIFAQKGKKIGAVKHDAHTFEIDYPGKDSYKMKHAGAHRMVISAKDKFALVEDREFEMPFDDLKGLFRDCDIVFVEGYKIWDIPKIEVHRKDTNSEYLIKNGVKNIVLVVTDELDRSFDVPVLFIDDIDGVVNFIEHIEHKFRMKSEHTAD